MRTQIGNQSRDRKEAIMAHEDISREKVSAAIKSLAENMPGEVIDEMAVPSYLHWNPLVRWIIRKRLRVIDRLLSTQARRYPGKKLGSILDFGCGIGLLGVLQHRNCDEIVSVDIEIEPIKKIKEFYRINNITPCSAEDFMWSDHVSRFDAVIAADVLEHVDDIRAYTDRIAEVLKKDGRFYLSGPTESWFYGLCRKIAGFTGEYHHCNIFDIESILEESNWTRKEIRKIPWFLPFKMFRVSVWNKSE